MDTHVIQVPIKTLTESLDQDPAIAIRWITKLNNEVRRLRLHLERLSMKSIRDRLTHLIETEGQAGQFPIPSGLKTLAGELGVTHEVLYRAIATLQSEGLLQKNMHNWCSQPISTDEKAQQLLGFFSGLVNCGSEQLLELTNLLPHGANFLLQIGWMLVITHPDVFLRAGG